MIKKNEIKKIARARLKDAQVLLASKRYDGAIYLCGYAIELSLKARICYTLKWEGYPDSNKEFHDYHCYRTHNLDVLLHLSGRELFIKNNYFAEWSNINEWSPSSRYQLVGTTKKADVVSMVDSATALLRKI